MAAGLPVTLLASAVGATIVWWDRAAFLAANRHLPCTPLDWVMPVFTTLGLGQVQALGALVIGVLTGWRTRQAATGPRVWRPVRAAVSQKWWLGPLLLCLILSSSSDVIKAFTPRQRPWWFYENQHAEGRFLNVQVRTTPGVAPLRVRGFPSGHTTSSVAMATVVTVLFWRRRRGRLGAAAAWALALVVAFSRVYLALHWPLDVLGGIVLGAACGLAAVWLCRLWAHGRLGARQQSDAADGGAAAGGVRREMQ